MRDKYHSQHLRGDLFCLGRRFCQLYAAALAAAACVDLRFDDNDVGA